MSYDYWSVLCALITLFRWSKGIWKTRSVSNGFRTALKTWADIGILVKTWSDLNCFQDCCWKTWTDIWTGTDINVTDGIVPNSVLHYELDLNSDLVLCTFWSSFQEFPNKSQRRDLNNLLHGGYLTYQNVYNAWKWSMDL